MLQDNYDLFARHDAEQEAELEKRPVCSCCCHPIQDEFCYQVDEEILCAECMDYAYRVSTENLME